MKKSDSMAGWNLEHSYAELPQIFYTRQNAVPVQSPEWIIFNTTLADRLGLNAELLQNSEGAAIFAGNELPDDAQPLAQAYAGHQFGNFNMLGDGRALLLGEQITPQGDRVDIQLKGSGRTPYSRGGDGRAAVGPMLREYIISEAMHGLGIPTTRSLAVVTTGENIYRETARPGAILTRVASSHIRVATFQYAAHWGSIDDLRALADYTILRHFPQVQEKEQPYLNLLSEVIKLQAELVAKWQRVGFIHGVMNTDNMAISGETIDYGPCAFMDTYNPATVFSSIDRQGRYAYGNQPYIAGWNLARFAETLLPLLHEDEEVAVQIAQDAIAQFSEQYHQHWITGMRAKLGLFTEEVEDEILIKELLELMENYAADYTNTFVALTLNKLGTSNLNDKPDFQAWHSRWEDRLDRQTQSRDEVMQQMKRNNPAVVPRNAKVEEVLERAEQDGDYSLIQPLLDILQDPYAYTPEQETYGAMPVACDPSYRTFCGT
ncbi:Protein adenylyltransferase SelO [Paenibacillus sp. JJ-100]|uniref:protein adenylyltransferase SelO n=1 Tax=Paenibacillus sp. JJ-100 TaxID=2974896 RepID=UPI0022FFBEB2|nr:YdiU family protein [Paenibacillus sp. JJ-100]CAI6055996.1 Protein adenylyltransferase SelO [Paenibacillus sp. JJ-100]